MRHTRDYDLPKPSCPYCGMSIAVQERNGIWHCYYCSKDFDTDEVTEHD